MEQNNEYYTKVTDYLQQGDIFRQEVVTPIACAEQRIFRTTDGRHGSVVFDEGSLAHVFDIEELKTLLNSCSRTALHTDPFTPTYDGHPEFVVTHSSLTTYFIIATQTCDVSGKDRPPLLTSIILPVKTVFEICRNLRLPFNSINNQETTIEAFIETNYKPNILRQISDEFIYPEVIRGALNDWQPTSTSLKNDRNKIRKFLGKIHEKGWMFYLEADTAYKIPESYIDFSAAFTVPTIQLNKWKEGRAARIADPYRDFFAQKLAHQLSRIAVPISPKPADY